MVLYLYAVLVTAALVLSLVVAQRPVLNLEACNRCCETLNTNRDVGDGANENVFDVLACGSGCVLDEDCRSFPFGSFQRLGCEIGNNFRDDGLATLNDGDGNDPNFKFFCSTGGELTEVEFVDSNRNRINGQVCANCCRDINTRFDLFAEVGDFERSGDQYSVIACIERCRENNAGLTDIQGADFTATVVNEDGNCIPDSNDPDNFFFNGCFFGQEMLLTGTIEFEGLNHHCTNVVNINGIAGTTKSVGAVVSQVPLLTELLANGIGQQGTGDILDSPNLDVRGDLENDCAECCLQLDLEFDVNDAYDVVTCANDGCNANRDCFVEEQKDIDAGVPLEERIKNREGCLLGFGFRTAGVANFDGREVICIEGKVKANVFNQRNIVNNNVVVENDDGVLVGTFIGGIAAAMVLFGLYKFRNSSGEQTETKYYEDDRPMSFEIYATNEPPVGSAFSPGANPVPSKATNINLQRMMPNSNKGYESYDFRGEQSVDNGHMSKTTLGSNYVDRDYR